MIFLMASATDVGEGNLEKNDQFGSDVTISDDATLMAVGARHGDGSANSSQDSGEVYLYKFDDGDFLVTSRQVSTASWMTIWRGHTFGLPRQKEV